MTDNFDLKKFLKESKAIENLNPVIGKNTSIHSIHEGNMKDKIREMVLAELGRPNDDYDGSSEEDMYGDYEDNEMGYFPTMRGLEDEPIGDEIDEAKKKDEEEVEVTDTETEELPVEDEPTDEAPATGGGLEDIAADMEGTEGDLMDALMKSLKIAKGMGNEKLETQIGNTLKFFVSEYIGGEEQ
jgi:hypothetical protein